MLYPRSYAWTPLQKCIIATGVLLALAAFGSVVYVYERDYRGPPKVPDREKQEEEIAEAVFRYQFLHNASWTAAKRKSLFSLSALQKSE